MTRELKGTWPAQAPQLVPQSVLQLALSGNTQEKACDVQHGCARGWRQGPGSEAHRLSMQVVSILVPVRGLKKALLTTLGWSMQASCAGSSSAAARTGGQSATSLPQSAVHVELPQGAHRNFVSSREMSQQS